MLALNMGIWYCEDTRGGGTFAGTQSVLGAEAYAIAGSVRGVVLDRHQAVACYDRGSCQSKVDFE